MILTSMICLSLNSYNEARGASEKDQIAINKVVMARVEKNNSTACDEVFKPGQFSWTTKYKNPKLSFKNINELKKYYNIKEDKAWNISVNSSIQSVISYNQSKDSKILFYHDHSIKKFSWNMKDIQPAYKTKYFIFYKTI